MPRATQPARELAALLRVFEVADGSTGNRLSFGRFDLPDGTQCEVYSTFARDVVCLSRQGHPTRVVRVDDLIEAILGADAS